MIKGKAQPPSILITVCGANAYAIVRPEVDGNWISTRIVKKMGSQISSRMVRKVEPQPRTKSNIDPRGAVYNKSDKSTGEYLELSCHQDKNRPSCHHLFHVTDAKRFDVVLGKDLPRGKEPQQVA
jgi:hypothetical protein